MGSLVQSVVNCMPQWSLLGLCDLLYAVLAAAAEGCLTWRRSWWTCAFLDKGGNLPSRRAGMGSSIGNGKEAVVAGAARCYEHLRAYVAAFNTVVWRGLSSLVCHGCSYIFGRFVGRHAHAQGDSAHDSQIQKTLMQVVDAYDADVEWVESTLSTLYTAKSESLKSFSIVEEADWDDFSEFLLVKLILDGAEAPRMKLKEQLAEVPYLKLRAEKIFDISLNYSAGGSQYMSCVKCAARRKADNSIVILYSLYEKRCLNRNFWESSPNHQRLRNCLEAGASRALVSVLTSLDATQALQE